MTSDGLEVGVVEADALCGICQENQARAMNLAGRVKLFPCEQCEEERAAQAKREREQEEAREREAVRESRRSNMQRNLQSIGVNTHAYGHCSFNSFNAPQDQRALQATKAWAARVLEGGPAGLFLYGAEDPTDPGRPRTGNGKTHLAVAALRQLLLEPSFAVEWARMLNVPNWLFRMQDTFNTGESTYRLVEEATRPWVLVLDDLGAEQCSEWALRSLYVVAEQRQGKCTLITSNYDLGAFEARAVETGEASTAMAARVASRLGGIIGQGNMVGLKGPDRRIHKQQ